MRAAILLTVSILTLLLTSVLGMSSVFGAPLTVKVKVEPFYYKSKSIEPLKGLLWISKSKSEATKGRAVLLLHAFKKDKNEWRNFGAYLQKKGFDVLAFDFRNHGKTNQKILVEDVQSAVVFLKTDKRVLANQVIIVGAELGANAAVQYASATPQMYRIIDALVLLSPIENLNRENGLDVPVLEPLRRTMGIPMFLIATRNDSSSLETIQKAKSICEGRCRVHVSNSIEKDLNDVVFNFIFKPRDVLHDGVATNG